MPLTTLRKAVSARTLMVFDLDGTLAPITKRPAATRLEARTRRLLAAVADCCPTVVLTGRDRRDAARILRGVPLRMIVGNHGLDLGGAGAARTVASWARQLQLRRRAFGGVIVERKTLSIAAHYRGVANPAATRRRVLKAVATLSPSPRVVPGKASLNLLPDIGLDKGTALRRLMRQFRARSAMYVGDDATDEAAFVAARDFAVLTVRVGTSNHTAARFSLASQRQIDTLLTRLLGALRALK